jgi:Chaperone of endosialidase
MSTKKFTTRHGIDANYQDIVSANNVSTNTLTSLVSTGTPPLTVSSTTKVENLNVDLLDGYNTATSNTANTVVVRDANSFISLNGLYMNSSEGLKNISWNNTYSTYDMELLNGVTLQVGQESLIYGRATETIQTGKIVMFAGAQGDGILLRLANTQVTGFQPNWIVGVATKTISQNNWGYVTWFGKVTDVDTYNYSLGDILYLDNNNPGAFSNTRPTAPDYAITLAAVVRVSNSPSSNNGILMVRPDFGYELSEAHDVKITNISANDVIIWSANNRWENKPQSNLDVGNSDKLDSEHGSYYVNLSSVAHDKANSSFEFANNVSSNLSANLSLIQGINDTQNTYIQAAYTHSNSAFNSSNTKFSSSGGIITGSVDIAGSLIVEGNFTVSGNVTTISANNLVLQDNMLYLNDDAETIINPDLGLAGAYNDGIYRHAGFFRDATDGVWKVYDSYEPEPDASPYIDTSNSTFRIADFQANNITANTLSGTANNANYFGGYAPSYYTNASNISSGTLSNDRLSNIPNSSLANTSITINGTNISLGSSGSITAGATITDDTTTNATRYVMLGSATSGAYTSANVSSTKLSFNPSTGTLSATGFSGSGASLTSIPNIALSNSSITINGSSVSLGGSTSISAGATITDDTTTNATRYIVFDDATSGSMTTVGVSSTKLTFNPSTGILSATGFSGPLSNALTFNTSGGAAAGSTYNGSAARTIDFSTVGAAASSHVHNYAGSASAGGAATSLSNFTVTTTTSVGAENTTSTIGYISGISLLGQSDGALYSHLYSADWKHQIYGDYRTGQIAIRGKNSGTWQAWRTVLDSSNYTSYAMPAGSSATNSVDVRAPIFYDSNNTGYYIDPAGTSSIVHQTLNGTMYFPSGGGGSTFSSNHYSMGKDIANSSWSPPHYADLIIGYHTGIRIGAAYSGIRFYNNSPTTDANNDGNGDGGESLLMTVGGHAAGTGVIVNNILNVNESVRSPIFYDQNDTYYYNDLNSSRRFAGRTYIHEWIEFVNFTGLYSPNNAAHFQPNDLSYGAWRIYGARNGWGGIEFSNASTTLMMNTDTYGFHYNGVGWRFYNQGGSGFFPGNVTAYWSDRRLKENLRPIGKESVDILSKLTAYRFNWNEKVKDFKIEIEPGKEEIGLIAQEVQDILPDAVVVNKSCSSPKEDGSGEKEEYLTINWNKITPILVQALNETRDELNNLKQLLTEKGII